MVGLDLNLVSKVNSKGVLVINSSVIGLLQKFFSRWKYVNFSFLFNNLHSWHIWLVYESFWSLKCREFHLLLVCNIDVINLEPNSLIECHCLCVIGAHVK